MARDDLARWVKRASVTAALRLDEEVSVALVSRAVEVGYAADLTDSEILKLGRDPFLLAYALRNAGAHCIVTTEVSKPSKQRANRHLPDVARRLGVATCTTFELTRALDFRTNWRA